MVVRNAWIVLPTETREMKRSHLGRIPGACGRSEAREDILFCGAI